MFPIFIAGDLCSTFDKSIGRTRQIELQNWALGEKEPLTISFIVLTETLYQRRLCAFSSTFVSSMNIVCIREHGLLDECTKIKEHDILQFY